MTAPYILIWPDLSIESENKYTWTALWINEFIWALDIVRKVFDKPKNSRLIDSYDIAMAYFKSTFALDLIAFLPQILSALDPCFAITKMLRLY